MAPLTQDQRLPTLALGRHWYDSATGTGLGWVCGAVAGSGYGVVMRVAPDQSWRRYDVVSDSWSEPAAVRVTLATRRWRNGDVVGSWSESPAAWHRSQLVVRVISDVTICLAHDQNRQQRDNMTEPASWLMAAT